MPLSTGGLNDGLNRTIVPGLGKVIPFAHEGIGSTKEEHIKTAIRKTRIHIYIECKIFIYQKQANHLFALFSRIFAFLQKYRSTLIKFATMRLMNFLKINLRKPWVLFLLIWIIVYSASTYIRLYPLWGHIWSPTNEQATLGVIFNLKKDLLNSLHQQYPEMPFEQANQLASEKMNEILHKDNARIRAAIEQANQNLYKQRNHDPAPIYLLEADPFYFYNLTQNIVDNGRIADVIKGNQYFNPLMGAPFGYWQPFTIHPYVGFIIYKISSIFDPNISLMSAVAFTPIVLMAFILFAFIWCARLFGLSYSAILIGCCYFALAPVFLKRSALGWYRTDPYNFLFPCLFLGIFFKNLTSTARQSIKSAIILSLTLLLYSLIWQGWIFLFFMTFICSGAIALYAWLVKKDLTLTRQKMIFAGTFLIITAAIGSLFYGFESFLSFFTMGAAELQKFTVKGMNFWPNLFLEVGELNKASVKNLLIDLGPFLILGSINGLICALTNVLRNLKQISSIKILLTALLLLITFTMTLKAERFIIFTILPLSLFVGFGFDQARAYLQKKKYGIFISFGLLALLLSLCWAQANASIRTVLTPIYNSVWEDALLAIKKETPKDSIINTWWPPGHFIKGIAERRVPFDGASLSESATGYWMANVLMNTDEKQASGILRMLNLSGNHAVDFLTQHGIKTSQAVALLNLIVTKPPMDAEALLKPFLNESDARQLLLLTHGGFPHSYVLIYNELVEQNAGLVFAARRNLQKIETINADARLLSSVPSPDSKEFIDFLWDLSGGPSKYSEALPLENQNRDILQFHDGIGVKRDMSSVLINSAKYGQGIPASIVFEQNGRVIEQNLPNANLNYSVVIYTQDKQPVCRLMDKSISQSLIIRMFFFDGKGLSKFKLIKSTNDLTSRTQIKVFEVLWN